MPGKHHLARLAATYVSLATKNLSGLLGSLFRVLYDFRPVQLSLPSAGSRRLVIFGTGPTLRETLTDIDPKECGDTDFMSVNEGYRDYSFTKFKPIYHVLADPIYWDPASAATYVTPLIAALDRSDWPVTVLLPLRAKGSVLHATLASRKAHITFYRSTTISGFHLFQYAAFLHRLGMPRVQNVLVAAISLGAWMQYPEIAVLGADHSWHETIVVNDRNIVCVRQLHSYENECAETPFLKPEGVGRSLSNKPLLKSDVFNMAEIFTAWSLVYESYYQLNLLTARLKCSVYNCSGKSFIDAFQRKPFKQFLRANKTSSAEQPQPQ
jgi:hypothetical protein